MPETQNRSEVARLHSVISRLVGALREVKCERCKGVGSIPQFTGALICTDCSGTGQPWFARNAISEAERSDHV